MTAAEAEPSSGKMVMSFIFATRDEECDVSELREGGQVCR